MWYFIAGAALNVAVTFMRNPIFVLQSKYMMQGLLFAAAVGAAIYGTIFWLIGYFFF